MSVVRIVKRVESLSHSDAPDFRSALMRRGNMVRCENLGRRRQARLAELWSGKGIYQHVEKVCCRSNLVLFAVDIDGDEPLLRIAAEGDAEVAGRVFHPEIRITGPRARLDLGVREAELRDEVCDAPLTLRSRCN